MRPLPLLLFCLAASLTACSHSSPSSPPSAPSVSASTAAPGDHERASFPVIVTLEQVATGDGQDTEFQLTLDVNQPLAYPLLITATVPPGVQLTGGSPEESVPIPQPGKLLRRFRTKGPLTEQAPFRIVVHGEASDHSSGIHADQQFPRAVETPRRPLGPPPPGGRPPSALPRR
ncbi:MAG: hypothetical protein RMJ98_03150 [Myxococcales bacterium]|nr:hypothetical protein [Polyangiaceae bacterium]MDW8248287.1 hypothetical protein [Myxococcales bacterium]